MAEQFYTIPTNIGKAAIANASTLGTKVNFTHFALGDGNGSYYNPTETQTELKNEVWRGQIGSITVDKENPNWIVLETIIPASIGGFMIREAGVFDVDGNLLAVGKYPETYKPVVADGSAKDLCVRMILEVANTSVVNLKIDPTIILATKKDIDVLSNRITKNENDITGLKKEVNEHKAEMATQDTTGHIKLSDIPVKSVNKKTGEVVIDVEDIAGLVSSKLALGKDASVGYSAVALGQDASAGEYAVALGLNTSAESNAVALGQNASAGGSFAVALGWNASAENANEGILGGTGSYKTSEWKVPGSFTVSGTKNFEIPHPKPEKQATHRIRHGAVESPTAGDTLYRYKIQAAKDNDIVTIDLPDYFIYLNKNVQIFVTPQGHFGNGYGRLNRENEQLEIYCQCEGEYNVLAIGTRNDNHQSVQDWDIKGVEREIGESWTGETYVFEVDEIMEVEEIKEVI